MKRISIIIFLSCFCLCSCGQSKNDDVLNKISRDVEDIGYRLHGLDRYKLVPTENIYTFLKLDTSTGQVYQLQWSLDNDKEFTIDLNPTILSDSGCGTYDLFPTKNMYQFILMNKVTGECWHIQWGMEYSQRGIRKIY